MTWQSPHWLWALLALPLLAAGLIAWSRSRRSAARAWADPRVLAVGPSRRTMILRGAAAAVALLAVAAGIVAMARPSITATEKERRSTVMLTVDVSNSMLAKDLQPSRLQAAVSAAEQFVDEAPEGTAVGLTTFADRASVVLAPTTDRATAKAALERIGETREGTALGEAVVTSLGALRAAGAVLDTPPADPSDSPARILVLTDGANSIKHATTPEQAAERAGEDGVPIYTILLGDDPGRPDQPLPSETLAAMSTRTGGVFAQSVTTEDLRAVFADIGSIVAPTQKLRELTVYAVLVAIVLLGVAAVIAALSRPRRPGLGGAQTA
jgi:Ca-activated chloride channel family protein